MRQPWDCAVVAVRSAATRRFVKIHRLRQIAFSALVALSPALVSPSRGQTTEETFRQLASELPFVSYGDFLSDSKPGYAGQDQVFKAWAALQAVMKTKPPFADLAKLVKHDDPKVRTLALLGLFDREEQAAFPLIHSLAEDAAATFPAQFEPGGRAIDEPLRLYTKPATVGSVALRMLETIGFRADWLGSKGREQTFAEWSARRLGNPDWIGWYDFLYRRASQAKSAQRIAALREKMAGLPQAVRAWMWMGLADDGMMIPQTDTALATEAEIIEAAKKLGPAALLPFFAMASAPGCARGWTIPRADGASSSRTPGSFSANGMRLRF